MEYLLKSMTGDKAGGLDQGQAPNRSRRGTLAWLAEEVSLFGMGAAMKALAPHLRGPADLRPFAVVDPGRGRPAYRTDLTEDDRTIVYWDHSAPPVWGPTFSVLRVQVAADTGHEFLFHAGEEALIPVPGSTPASADAPSSTATDAEPSGGIQYNFITADASGARVLPPEIVNVGEAIRINPQIPHHASAVNTPAAAWMIMRSVTDSPYKAVVSDAGYAAASPVRTHRNTNLEQLRDPEVYAAVAWGLSEYIRAYRQRADLTIKQLAEICRVEAALISRLERVQDEPDAKGINVSLDALVRIAAYLAIPFPSLIARSQRVPYDRDPLGEVTGKRVIAEPILWKNRIDHELHFTRINVPAGVAAQLPSESCFSPGTLSAWIVLKGALSVTLDTNDPFPPSDPMHEEQTAPGPVMLLGDSVIHFRYAAPRAVKAVVDTQIIQVIHSTHCGCTSSE